MEINNRINKVLGVLFLCLVIWFVYDNILGGNAKGKANESLIRKSLSDFSKDVAIAYTDMGNYGKAKVTLPYIGCSLSNTYLDLFKNALIELGSENVQCISAGDKGTIYTWSISVKVSDNKYWCQDHSGDRKALSSHPTSSKCD